MADEEDDGNAALELEKAFALALQREQAMTMMFDVGDGRVAFAAMNVTDAFVLKCFQAMSARYPDQFRSFVAAWAIRNREAKPKVH